MVVLNCFFKLSRDPNAFSIAVLRGPSLRTPPVPLLTAAEGARFFQKREWLMCPGGNHRQYVLSCAPLTRSPVTFTVTFVRLDGAPGDPGWRGTGASSSGGRAYDGAYDDGSCAIDGSMRVPQTRPACHPRSGQALPGQITITKHADTHHRR